MLSQKHIPSLDSLTDFGWPFVILFCVVVLQFLMLYISCLFLLSYLLAKCLLSWKQGITDIGRKVTKPQSNSSKKYIFQEYTHSQLKRKLKNFQKTFPSPNITCGQSFTTFLYEGKMLWGSGNILVSFGQQYTYFMHIQFGCPN